jgi:hypothetical protein
MPSLHPFLDADRELARRVTNFLSGQSVPALRAIQVEATNGAVTLRGQVRTFYEKQLSHHSASRVAGVRQVIDEVQVVWTPRHDVLTRSDDRRRKADAVRVYQVTLPLPQPAKFSPARSHFADRAIG